MQGLFKGISFGLPRIKAVLLSLSPAEERVARYVLSNPQKTMALSIQELSDAIGVAESTIIRFCKNVGFSGFKDLKMALVGDVVTESLDIGREFSENVDAHDPLDVMVGKLGFANCKAIEEANRLLDLGDVERAIDAVFDAERVLFYGIGASSATALDGRFRFYRLGVNCDAIIDGHLMLMSAVTAGPKDVIILFSVSGRTKELLDVAEKAKSNGATVISITDRMESPLAKHADIRFITGHVQQPYGSGALRTKIAQLHVLDLLYTGVSIKLGKKGRFYMELTGRAVFEKMIAQGGGDS